MKLSKAVTGHEENAWCACRGSGKHHLSMPLRLTAAHDLTRRWQKQQFQCMAISVGGSRVPTLALHSLDEQTCWSLVKASPPKALRVDSFLVFSNCTKIYPAWTTLPWASCFAIAMLFTQVYCYKI
jgi:hypothetical protein